MNEQRGQVLGFAVLLLISLLFLWGAVTGRLADASASLLAPSLLETSG